MKKILPIVVVGILVLSGLIVGASDSSKNNQTNSIQSKNISFSEPVLKEKGGYLTLELGGADKKLTETDNPMLPMYVTSFTFSWNAKIKDVTCALSDVREMTINKKIIPAPAPILLTETAVVQDSTVKENSVVYGSDAIFPDAWYTYDIKCGLNNMNQPSIFVTVTVYPVRYSPANNKLYYVNNADITVTCDDPGYQPTNYLESYDMVIIAPQAFSSALQPLITHKNNYGVKTILKTTESIYSEFSGRDKPEQIKYFIKYARENWGITYVLLAGGLKSYFNAKDKDDTNQGSTDWWVPVRYENAPSDDGHGCISDLYYGDIYRYNTTSHQTEFEDWDSNGNGIFAEWSGLKKDKVDLIPDVYYGRLACVTTNEVTTVVNKIINYEKTTPASKPWLTTMIGIGGKTFNIYQGQPDGEYLCDLSISYMGSLVTNPIRVYASNNNTGKPVPIPADIEAAISGGAGYVNFEGHGNPLVWDTIWADGEYPYDWAGGIAARNFNKLKNGDKLPVVIVGGCHNALFNISLIQTLRSGNRLWTNIPILKKLITPDSWYWCYGVPAAKCFSWKLVVMSPGGAIASTGCTGYGMGPGSGDPNGLSGELETNFFYQIGQNGSKNLGNAHSGGIKKYVLEEGVHSADEQHCVMVYELFGDPSLKLGGYEK